MAVQNKAIQKTMSGQIEDINWDSVVGNELPRLYNYFRYRLGDEAVAQDLTSIVFEKAWTKRHRYRKDRAAFSAWLFAIAKNEVIAYLRRRRISIPISSVPDGYEREADAHLYVWGDGTPTLEVFWRKKGEFPMIGLFIAQCKEDAQGCGMTVGEGALEAITLNGKPVTLVRGSWNEEAQQYELPVMVSIIWRYDENSFYRLWSFDQSLEGELIKMAESIP